MTVTILFVILGLGVALGLPIALSLIVSTAASSVTAEIPLTIVAQKLVTSNDSFPLMAIPLFILAGSIMSNGGVSKRLINFADSFVGWITGGIGIVANLAGMFFSAISGSSAATSAAVGTIMGPELEKRGYKKEFTAALIAASGQTGIIIPPSVTMVVYGVIAGTSIGDLFLGGFIPGILMGLSMCVLTYCTSRRLGYKGEAFKGTANIVKTLGKTIWGLLMPVIILGGIYGGIFTPTEAAAVAVIYGLIIGLFVHRELTPRSLVKIMEDTVISSAAIMIIMNAAGLFSWLLTREQVPVKLANYFVHLTGNPFVYLLLVNMLLIIAGMLLNPSAAVTILAPILVPVAIKYGIDPVFFGVMMVSNLAIGSLTPPVGTGLFVASSISGVSLERVAKASFPYILVLLVDLLLIIVFPGIITFLPGLAK
jgi:C4-dicarboxylate transporter DctM subunit